MEVLSTIEWDTQHLKLQESFPVALHAEMAPDARVDADHDAFKRGATVNPLWCPP